MISETNLPVTVKHRLGVDNLDKWDDIVRFIDVVSEKGGVNKFIVHARKVFLKGLSSKQNRNIPPLKHDWVIRLKKEFPHLDFVINGGFNNMSAIHNILQPKYNLQGVMVGRMALYDPWKMSQIDHELFG